MPQCTYSNTPISLCPYSYKSSLCVGVTVLPDLVTYPPGVPEVLPGTLVGDAVSSAIQPFGDVSVRPIGAGLVAC